MQNKIIPSILTAALLSVSSMGLAGGPEVFPEPDYFSGFYIGGFGGVMHATFNGSSNLTLTQPITIFNIFPVVQPGLLQSNSLNGGDWGGLGGLQGGFGREINHMFYAGVQAWGWWGDASYSNTNNFTPSSSVITTPGGLFTFSKFAFAGSTTTAEVRDNVGVAAKFGWVVAPGSMLYGKVGANWADVKVSENTFSANGRGILFNRFNPSLIVFSRGVSTSSSSSNQDTKIGLASAVGFEQFVYQDVASINVEAGYTNYGNVSTTGQVTGSTNTTIFGFALPTRFFGTNIFNTASTDAKVSTLTAGINFYFGRNSFGI